MSWNLAKKVVVTRAPMPAAKPRRFPRRSVEELLDDARKNEARALARFEQKNAAVQKYENLKRRRERKLDTRRKIIAGAIALEHMNHNAAFAAAFEALLDRFVTKGPERTLFGLKPLPLGKTHPSP